MLVVRSTPVASSANLICWPCTLLWVGSQQSEHQWTEHTTLGCTSVQCGVTGVGVANPDGLASPSKKVQDPVTKGSDQTQHVQPTEAYEQHPHIIVFFVQVGQRQVDSSRYGFLCRYGCLLCWVVREVGILEWVQCGGKIALCISRLAAWST